MKTTYKELDQLKEKLNHLRQYHSEKVAKAFDIELQSLNYLLPQQFLKLYILSF